MTSDSLELWKTSRARQCAWSAILFADVVGYSRLMGSDELGTLEFIVLCRQMIEEAAPEYGGILVQTTGDGFLLLFSTSKGAVAFGRELHVRVAKRPLHRMGVVQLRIGIHAGTIYRTGGQVHGHAVNIAARLEALALPGTCVVSQDIYDDLLKAGATSIDGAAFEAIGAPPLKNIDEKVHLYRLSADGDAPYTASADRIRIDVLGGLSISSATTEIEFAVGTQTSALLGYLALSPTHRERYAKVASVLWPDREPSTRMRSFVGTRRRLFARLQSAFPDLLVGKNARIGLNESFSETNLDRALSGLRIGRVATDLLERANWPAEILEGFEANNHVYASWLEVIRSTWRERILSELTNLIARGRPGDESCHDAARAILVLEPTNEFASTARIRYLGLSGNRVSALEEYDRLSDCLATAHGLSPSDQVEVVRRELLSGSRRPAEADDQELPMPQKRLLRLSVENFFAPEDVDTHRVDGFRIELISNLARFREWSVIEGVFPEKKDDLSGTIRNAYGIGGRLFDEGRFNLYLRDHRDGRVIWSGDFTLNPINWVASQRAAIGRIAAQLDTYISADRLAQIVGEVKSLPVIHDQWLLAEQIFARWTPEAADEAEAILRTIAIQDPTFAPALSSLASFRNVRHIIRPGLSRDADKAQEAYDLAQRAVELDPLDARNQSALAWTAALTGAYDRAAVHFELAVDLNPNSQSTLISCAMAYAFIGQADRGEALVDHVLRIAPMLSDYQWCYVAAVHFLAGRYEDALKAAQMSGDRIVDNQGWLSATLVQLDRVDEARSALDRLIDEVRLVWAGNDSPTAEAVFDWFADAYPLRNSSDRDRLVNSLAEALRGQ